MIHYSAVRNSTVCITGINRITSIRKFFPFKPPIGVLIIPPSTAAAVTSSLYTHLVRKQMVCDTWVYQTFAELIVLNNTEFHELYMNECVVPIGMYCTWRGSSSDLLIQNYF
jgi:hypothetical protein